MARTLHQAQVLLLGITVILEPNGGDTRSVSPGFEKASYLYREEGDDTTSIVIGRTKNET